VEEVMAKKSKSKKSKAKKTTSESPEEAKSEIPNEAASPSWSVDDVYTLLKAVNEVTLKRMEDILSSVKDTGANTNHGLRGTIQKIDQIEQGVRAIKAKTDRLP
jgi:CHASE3 domain sensor protein